MVYLRPVSKSDIDFIYKIRNDPNIREYMFDTNEIDYKKHVEYWLDRMKNSVPSFIIVDENGNDVGLLKLDPISDNKYSIGIIISVEYQGRGYGKEAVKEILSMYKDATFIARVKVNNNKSIKLFESCGFRKYYVEYIYP